MNETGHVLGLPHHPDQLNIMSYGPNRQRFAEAQIRVLRARARRLLRTRALRGSDECDAPPGEMR